MSLVCRPQLIVGKYKGYDVILRSEETTANYELFREAVDGLEKKLDEINKND